MSVPPDPATSGASHPDPELLVLAALPAEPADPAVSAHVAGCSRCRAEVDDLRRTVELAREEGVVDALPPPPPQVWRAIAAELGLPAERNGQVGGAHGGGAPGAVDGAVSGRVDGRRPPRAAAPAGRAARRVLVPLVAAVLGLAAGLGVGRAWAPEPVAAPVPTPAGQLGPVDGLDPGASGTVGMVDDRGAREMVVDVRGVTNLAGGDHLEAWLMDASGTRLVPLGPLDGGDGDFQGTFAVPAGLPLGEFDRVDVSVERWDGNPDHSTVSVLRGDL